MMKDVLFEWDEVCQRAFDIIKACLTKPPVLANPIKAKPLVLYINALVTRCLLAQENTEGKENALHYLSWTLVGLKRGIPLSRRYAWHLYLPSKS